MHAIYPLLRNHYFNNCHNLSNDWGHNPFLLTNTVTSTQIPARPSCFSPAGVKGGPLIKKLSVAAHCLCNLVVSIMAEINILLWKHCLQASCSSVNLVHIFFSNKILICAVTKKKRFWFRIYRKYGEQLSL